MGWFCVEDDGNQIKKERHPLLVGHMPVTVAKQQEFKVTGGWASMVTPSLSLLGSDLLGAESQCVSQASRSQCFPGAIRSHPRSLLWDPSMHSKRVCEAGAHMVTSAVCTRSQRPRACGAGGAYCVSLLVQSCGSAAVACLFPVPAPGYSNLEAGVPCGSPS